MSLLRRIEDDRSQRLGARLTREREAERLRAEHRALVQESVERTVRERAVARVGGTRIALLTPGRLPLLAVVDDVVLRVDYYPGANRVPSLRSPDVVAQEFVVALVGVEPLGRPVFRRVGMLALLDYEGIFRAVEEAGGGLSFRATDVLKAVDF